MKNSLSLNLRQARVTLSPFEAEPVEFPDGGQFYKPESVAAGGTEFSHHRYFRCSIYAQDCLPTENGYESVHTTDTTFRPYSDSNLCRAEWVVTCDGEEETLLLYAPEDIVDVAPQMYGHIILDRDGTVSQVRNTGDDCDSTLEVCEVELKGIEPDNPCIKGVAKVHGHTIIYTAQQLFYNGAEDYLDYTPQLRSTAGSYAISADIGAIQTIIPSSNGMYVLGNRGGVYGECSGDLHFPHQFREITNFDGIPYQDAARADYNSDSIIVLSHSGLVKISATRADVMYADISRFLREGRYSELINPCRAELCESKCPTQSTLPLAPFPPVVFDPCEFRDVYECCEWNFLYREYNVLEGCEDLQHIMVNNLTPRYTTISYASVLTEPVANTPASDCIDCDSDEYEERYNWRDPENYRVDCNECADEYTEACYCYNRLLVLDHYTQRSSVLHCTHTDVIRPRHGTKAEFIIIQNEEAREVRMGGGVGHLYFHEFERGDNSTLIITNLDARGRFDTDAYQDALTENTANIQLTRIHTVQGVDRLNTELNDPWWLTEIGARQIQYGGIMRSKTLSFVYPFVGRLTELKMSLA